MEKLAQDILQAIADFNIWIGIGVSVAYFAVDAMYAHYTLAVSQARALSAATTGALMHFLLAVGVLGYVQNFLYIIPIAIGSWFGTYYIVNKEAGKRITVSQNTLHT